MAIMISAYSAPRPNGHGGMEAPTLHLHQGCPGAGCDSPDSIAVNFAGEAYAIMRAIHSGLRYDDGNSRYVRNRVHTFRLWGDVRDEEFTRDEVTDLPVNHSHPDHPEYATWRTNRINAAASVTVESAHHITARLARALHMPNVADWEDAWDRTQRAAAGSAARVNHTTAEQLTIGSDNPSGEPVYVRVLPAQHPIHAGQTTEAVHRHEGYWFTVPADFPAALPGGLHQSRETFAVFQSPDIVAGALVWVVRSQGATARTLGTSTESRRAAVREALETLAYTRTEQAREIEAQQEPASLPPAPAVRIAVSDDGAWVLHVRCSCPIGPDETMGDAPTVGDAAELFAGEPDPWGLCDRAPVSLRDDDGTPYAHITASGRRGASGEPVLSVKPIGDRTEHTVQLSAIGARNI